MHLILIPTYHTITHLCFGNEHTIFSCVKMKSMNRKKGTVCGVMTFFYAHAFATCRNMMVIWYDKCVCFHTTCSCSITCQKWDIRNSFILPTTHTENTDQLCLGLCFFIRMHADGRCGQMSVEYDQVRLAAIGI